MQIVTGSIYVVLFSTGLIKVGKAHKAEQRIADHTKRLGCAGISVAASSHAECLGDYTKAETALISRCREVAHTRRGEEWFEGLDYETVCEWMREEAAASGAAASSEQIVIPSQGEPAADDRWFESSRFYLSPWMEEKAMRFARLCVEAALMEAPQADAVYDAMTLQDQFLLNDLSAFSDDLDKAEVPTTEWLGALASHALDIIFVQTHFWWRGTPQIYASDEPFVEAMAWRREFDRRRHAHTPLAIEPERAKAVG